MAFSASLKAVSKSYTSVHANQAVSFIVKPGTIHALVGENGAGKSTAMKILYGLERADSGEVLFDGKLVPRNWNPRLASLRGIGMVHQHFMLAPDETVHDNLVLGTETTHFGFRRRKAERERLLKLMKETGLQVPLGKRVNELPIGLQSRCEILKVLYRGARFLILDEPTAVLAPQEVQDFLKVLHTLREHGCTILLVTHKLKEVMAVADEVTVLRQGKSIATLKASDTNSDALATLMVGRSLCLPRVEAEEKSEDKPPLLCFSHGTSSFELRAGQITGIAGVEGSGQAHLVQLVLEEARKRRLPISLIPADRHHEGLVLSFSLIENLRLSSKFSKIPFWRHFAHGSATELKLLQEYDVRPFEPGLSATALSGGNQQKLIAARELAGIQGGNAIVIAMHPTRGVDLGAIEFLHTRLIAVAKQGAAVLLVSSELEELMSLSHRLGVLYHGNIASWISGGMYDENEIGRLMLTGAA